MPIKPLPAAQHALLRLWVLGGIDAIGVHSTATVRALIKAGWVDRDGPTREARAYIDRTELASIAS